MLKIVLNSVLLTSYTTVPHPHSQNHNLPDLHWELRNALLLAQIHPIEFLCSSIWPQNCPFKQYLFTSKEKRKDHPELDHGETVWGLELLYLIIGTAQGNRNMLRDFQYFEQKKKQHLDLYSPYCKERADEWSRVLDVSCVFFFSNILGGYIIWCLSQRLHGLTKLYFTLENILFDNLCLWPVRRKTFSDTQLRQINCR